MARKITQRQLRKDSHNIVRALSKGESFVLTRNGITIGELTPLRRRHFVHKATVIDAFESSSPIDTDRFRPSIDRLLDQDPELRV